MSLAPKASEDPASLRRGNFTYFPVIPGRLEFSIELRRAILRDRPRIVAGGLPGAQEDKYLQSLGRLPGVSNILFSNPNDHARGGHSPGAAWRPYNKAARSG